MDWADLFKWFVIAGVMGGIVVLRSRKKTAEAKPEEIEAGLGRRFTTGLTAQELRARIEQAMHAVGCTLHSANETRLVYDSKSIGLFHWGFLYIIDFPSDEPGAVSLGIFGKGPNPPRGKALQKHLDAFLDILGDIPMQPQDPA